MADYLKKNGVPVTYYILENRARNSFENLSFSSSIVDSIEHERPDGSPKLRIGIITGGFHIPRTRMAAVVLSEIRKLATLKKFKDYKLGPFR